MKEKDIDFQNYDHIAFVDSSGDDGFSFREKSSDGSSFTFVSSCFVTKPRDIPFNERILSRMKEALHIDTKKELKSTTLKRHRFASDAYTLLDDLVGQCFSMVAFKKDLIKYEDYAEFCNTRSKKLSGLTQAFPYYAIHRTEYFKTSDKILIVMDNMKKTEMSIIEELLKEYQIDLNVSYTCDLIFRDSQHFRYPLIQIADIIAGTLRDYFESHMQRTELQRLCRICETRPCRSPRGKRLLNSEMIGPRYATPLSMHRSPIFGDIMLAGIATLPLEHFRFYRYIDCKLRNKKRN